MSALAALFLAASGCATYGDLARPELGLRRGRTEGASLVHSFEEGLASWYGRKFHGRTTASGTKYDMFALTAAHRTLPFGSRVRVTNLDNGRTVVLDVNDRGPYVDDRIVDVSYAAAKALDFVKRGLARVRLEVLPPSHAPGSAQR